MAENAFDSVCLIKSGRLAAYIQLDVLNERDTGMEMKKLKGQTSHMMYQQRLRGTEGPLSLMPIRLEG